VDVVRAEAAISSAEQSIIGSQNAVQVTKSVLNRIMGQDVNAPIEIELPRETAFQTRSYEEYLAEAYAKRPEVAIASTNLTAAEKLYKVAKKGMYPALVASATAQIDDAHDCPEYRYTTVGLSLILPIYDGEETRGRKVQAAADIKSARVAVDETKALVALQVKIACVHMQDSEKKLTTAKKEMDQATETLRLSRSRYAEGIANQVELSDAELSFTQAQTNVVNARFELLSSRAELDQAVGRHAMKDQRSLSIDD
jgi:outer membrane protein TolC